ncbi:MAG: hypothetical protein ACTSQJ_17335 [Promethearchaeota archaeon]
MTRRLGILAGIIALLLAFIFEIPIFPPQNIVLNFNIITIDNVYYFYWGYVINGTQAFTSITLKSPENLVPLSLWLIIIIIGINSIIASTNNTNIVTSLKLYKTNIIFTIMLLTIFGIIAASVCYQNIFSLIYLLGLGYYLTLFILFCNIISLKSLKIEE